MQLSHATAFWLRLAGNILLDLLLYVHMFCSPVAREIIRRLVLLLLEGRAALTVEVTRLRGRPASRCTPAPLPAPRRSTHFKPLGILKSPHATCTPSRVHIPDVSSANRKLSCCSICPASCRQL